MARLRNFRRILFISVLAIVLSLTALFALRNEETANINLATIGEEETYTHILSCDEWNKFTYKNAPRFIETTFLDEPSYYYALEEDENGHYSMNATLTSPELDIFPRESGYSVSFNYFTRQKSTVGNKIKILTSNDGTSFTEQGETICYDNNAPLDMWSSATVELNGEFRYIRFEIIVYYSLHDGVLIENGGIYLCKEFSLIGEKIHDIKTAVFEAGAVSGEFTYSGEAIYPSVDITAGTNEPYYVRYVAEKDGVPIEPINAGIYNLFVEIYDETNERCFRLDCGAYVIKKRKIKDVSHVEIYSNGRYAVLCDAEITDENDNKVSLEELSTEKIVVLNNGVCVIEFVGANYESFIYETEIVTPSSDEDWVLYVEEKDVVTEYDGNVKSVSDNIKMFSEYNPETKEFKFESGATAVKYYFNGEEIEPKNVGIYDYSVKYGSYTYNGTLTITPKILEKGQYIGSYSLNKFFDGTTAIAVDGHVGDELASDGNFDIDGVLTADGDKVKLNYDEILYERTTGNPYLVFKNPCLYGEKASNYALADEFYAKCSVKISPVTLTWADLNDLDGNVLTLEDKIYDASTSIKFLNDPNGKPKMLGLGDGTVRYSDIDAVVDSPYCGRKEVSFKLNNAMLFDRYNREIVLLEKIYANIIQRNLKAEAKIYSGENKIYDGTNVASPEIKEIEVVFGENNVDLGDGLKEFLTEKKYGITYGNAVYSDSDSGNDKDITVSGISIVGYDAESEAVFSNYIIEELKLKGNVEKKSIEVLTEYIYVKTGESLPQIETTDETGNIVFNPVIYRTEADAENRTDAVSNKNIQNGEYFVRIDCESDGNYDFVGGEEYALIPLTVAGLSAKKDQKLESSIKNEFERIIIPIGGQYNPEFRSVTYDGKATRLKPTYSVDSNVGAADEDGNLYGLQKGVFTLTVTQEGNDYYNPAETVEIEVEVVDIEFVGEVEGYETVLYVGNGVPIDLGGYTTVKANGNITKGNLVPVDNILLKGSFGYPYVFEADDIYINAQIGFDIDTTLYENREGIYELTSDTVYVAGKEYYTVRFVIAETVAGETIPDDETFYEFAESVYVPTSDVVFAEDKIYYAAVAERDETLKTKGEYYVLDGDNNYVEWTGEYFVSGYEYYYLGKPFYGEAIIPIDLNAVNKTLSLNVNGRIDVGYGEKIPFKELIGDISVIAGTDVETAPYKEYVDLISEDDIKLYKASISGEGGFDCEQIDFLIPRAEEYRLKTTTEADGDLVLFYVGEIDGYDVVLSGTAFCKVNKSVVNVKINNFVKYYYEKSPTEEEYAGEIIIEGIVFDEDRAAIVDSAKVSSDVSISTATGDYAIRIEPKEDSVVNHEYYEINYKSGYLTVMPMPVTVTAYSDGHVYGEDVSPVVLKTTVSVSGIDDDERNHVSEYISKNTEVLLDANKFTDVGSYPLSFVYSGKDNNFVITFEEGNYVIHPALITGIQFRGKEVLYDGKRHTIQIEYDESEWQDLNVQYDKDYFTEKGIYSYTATITKKNYKALILHATLTIGTDTIGSSSLKSDYVSLKINDETCVNGVNPNYTLRLEMKSELGDDVLNKINEIFKTEEYEINGAYDVNIYLSDRVAYVYYDDYTLTMKPSGIEYSDKLKLFGRGKDGEFEEIDFTYVDGQFVFDVSDTANLVFVTIKEVVENPIVNLMIIIGIGFGCIVLIGVFIISVNKRSKRAKKISRRRHHRWA